MSNSRDDILNKLRNNVAPFPEKSRVESYLPMVKLDKKDPTSLLEFFKSEAEKLSAQVTVCTNEEDAQKSYITTNLSHVELWKLHAIREMFITWTFHSQNPR